MKEVEIKWDVDNEEDLEFLPTEIEIPDGMNDEDEISDYLSDFSGFCHKGFKLEHEKQKKGKRKWENKLSLFHMMGNGQTFAAVFLH